MQAIRFWTVLVVVWLFVVWLGPRASYAQEPAPLSANVSPFATGLVYPRGLEVGPDGSLYVAESGTGGETETDGTCEAYVSPFAPYHSGLTARISRISPTGERSTIADGLPSARDQYGDVLGVSDVAFIDGTLYALVMGGGCSRGFADFPASVIRVNADGTTTIVADLSAFFVNEPTAAPIEPDDWEPDGAAYSTVAHDEKLYVVNANHADFLEVTPDGAIRRVVDISASQGHVTPAPVAFHDGAFYIGTLGEFPIKQGSSQVYRITPDGQLDIYVQDLTALLGLAFDEQGQLYVLETSHVDNDLPQPGTGRVLRVKANGEQEIVASGLSFPTGMTFGLDGQLYVSHFGYGGDPGKGAIVRVDVNAPLDAPPALPQTGSARSGTWALLVGLGLLVLLVTRGFRAGCSARWPQRDPATGGLGQRLRSRSL